MDIAIQGVELTEKIAAITHEIGAVPKTKKPGSTVSYAYRGIDDIMNALNPQLAKHKVTMRQRVISHDLQRVETEKGTGSSAYKKVSHVAVVHLALHFSDGLTEVVTEEVAMSEDFSDKAYTQAMSMAFKYAITRMFCIPTEDLVDPDESAQVAPIEKKQDNGRQVPVSEKPAAKNTTIVNKNSPTTSPVGDSSLTKEESKAAAPVVKPKKPIKETDGEGNLTKEWANTVQKLTTGKVTLEQVKGVYELTGEQEVKLKALQKK